MTRDEAEKAVRLAIEEHISRERGLVTAPDKLVLRVLEGLGYAESFVRSGWLVERLPGSAIPGTKPRYRKFRGWRLTDTADGEVRWMPPSDSQGDVSQYWAEKFADQYRAMKNGGKPVAPGSQTNNDRSSIHD